MNYEAIGKMNSRYMGDEQFRTMLCSLRPMCHVESEVFGKGGTVKKIFSRSGIPLCVQAEDRMGKLSWLNVYDISFFEPCDYIETWSEH